MNLSDNILALAHANSGTCHPKRLEEIDTTLPYFHIEHQIGSNSKYSIRAFNYTEHDNAPRMGYILNWLANAVFPRVEGSLNGYYNIQLHDNYSYLEDGKSYKDVLCFGKLKRDKGPVQLPDCYFIGDWGQKYHNFKDTLNWNEKSNKIVFAGTTTGKRDPLKNERIQSCLWARQQPILKDICDVYITNIAQIDPQRIFKEVPDFKYIYRPPIPMEQQLTYRYHLGMDGNTCRWYPDTYFTNSLLLQMPSDDMLWYYPLICEGTHFVSVDKTNLLQKYHYYENNPNEAMHITRNAQRLARQLFTPDVCREYTVALFNHIVQNK